MKDYAYSGALKIYVAVDLDGNILRHVDITFKKPDFDPAGSPLIKKIEEYFETGRADFSGYTPDLSSLTDFEREVLNFIRTIPPGKIMTYSEVASAVNRPKAARAVGNTMAKNPILLIVPCHRVVAVNGLGGFTGSLAVKRALLELEGAL